MRGLKGKVAIVTGATKAIGIATAERLGAEGMKVLGCGRDIASGEQCAERIRANGGIAEFVRCDIGIEEQVRNVIAAALSKFGRLDTVVNVAAASDAVIANGRRSVTEEANEGLIRQLAIDLIAPFWFFKYLIPEMKKVEGGNFVNILSLNAVRPVPGLSSYSAAKAGLEALSRSVAVDYADSNIRSNCISVGPVRVAANAEMHDHPVTGSMLRQFLTVNRAGRPEDVAGMVAFLASDDSSWISGDTIPLNGGATAKLVLPDLAKISQMLEDDRKEENA